VFYLPATGLADENSLNGLANMIILGKLLKETAFAQYDSVIAGLKKSVPARKADLVDANIKAISIGMDL
jgi:Pyruvate ferredoxin/flavodoxin oxidoreductase.